MILVPRNLPSSILHCILSPFAVPSICLTFCVKVKVCLNASNTYLYKSINRSGFRGKEVFVAGGGMSPTELETLDEGAMLIVSCGIFYQLRQITNPVFSLVDHYN